MIARVWYGAVRAGRGDEYAAYLDRTGTRECRATPGNRGILVLRHDAADQTEFVFISLWESIAVIRGFAGDDVERARYFPEDRDFLLALDPTVRHYDLSVSLPPELGR